MLFSIIVPVYNAQAFLEKTIQSVLQQTYEKWELILINDGSADGSQAVMDFYGAKDGRIHCFTQENRGVSRTRNRGIELAQGEYVIFVDADDEIHPDLLKTIFISLQEKSSDVVVFQAYRTDINSKVIGKVTVPFQEQVLILETEQEKRCLYSALASDMPFGLAWNFAAKRNMLLDIRFPEQMILCEDLLFGIKMYEKAKTVTCLPDYLYNYRDNPMGCVNQFNYRKLEDLKIVCEEKLGLIQRHGLEKNRSAVLWFFASSVVQFYHSVLENEVQCLQYCQRVSEDPEIVRRIEEYRQLGSPGAICLDYVFGTPEIRHRLRKKLLIKRKLRAFAKKLLEI